MFGVHLNPDTRNYHVSLTASLLTAGAAIMYFHYHTNLWLATALLGCGLSFLAEREETKRKQGAR